MDYLCLDFINSRWYNTHKPFEEMLLSEQWLDNFLRKWKLTNIDLDKKDINSLMELREYLFKESIYISKYNKISNDFLNKANSYLLKVPLSQKLSINNNVPEITIVDNLNDTEHFKYSIISSFINMITSQPLNRIKSCENDECNWIYLDESKNQSRKWCDNTCASLIKVRRHREKQSKGGKNNEV